MSGESSCILHLSCSFRTESGFLRHTVLIRRIVFMHLSPEWLHSPSFPGRSQSSLCSSYFGRPGSVQHARLRNPCFSPYRLLSIMLMIYSFIAIRKMNKAWEKLLQLIALMVFVTPNSNIYTLTFLIGPLILFLFDQDHEAYEVILLSLLVTLFIPVSYWHFGKDELAHFNRGSNRHYGSGCYSLISPSLQGHAKNAIEQSIITL